MLKPMKPKQTIPNNIFLWALVGLLVLSGIIALITAFSSGDNAEDEVNAVYTNAAATLAAQQLTLEAAAPTATPTVVTETPTATFTPLASPTLFATQPGVANPSSGGTGSGAVGCNNSTYVDDVTVPDDTVMTPGQTFTKTWKLQNTGSCAWSTSYKVTFVSGNAMSGVTTPLTVAVQPGQSGDVSVAMKAPATAGDAIGYWILTNDSGQNFGTTFYVKIKVGAAASTTGTATATTTTGTATATATTAAASAPAAVGNVGVTLICTSDGNGNFDYSGTTISWADQSNNESGFYIYINNQKVSPDAAANTTSYTVAPNTIFPAGSQIPFGVASFNGVGASNIVSVINGCQ
ncbi:MAG: hypothetical protein Fur0017_19420 [Anaerolineales bacterium]